MSIEAAWRRWEQSMASNSDLKFVAAFMRSGKTAVITDASGCWFMAGETVIDAFSFNPQALRRKYGKRVRKAHPKQYRRPQYA